MRALGRQGFFALPLSKDDSALQGVLVEQRTTAKIS